MDINKTLVAYFSCTGTTRRAAQALAAAVDADVYGTSFHRIQKPHDLTVLVGVS